ncbi:MAG: flagellar assembly protein FliW [Acidobacteriota bacterium]
MAETEQFGVLEYEDDAELLFPRGLPGFEQAHRFVLIKQPDLTPLVQLQSLDSPSLCFLSMPVHAIDSDYQSSILPEDSELVGLGPDDGASTVVLALLSVTDQGHLSANLLAPIVINLTRHLAVQAVRIDTAYSHEHLLLAERGPSC